jgi:N-acetylated-alpha-linked acidic dipeptidase
MSALVWIGVSIAAAQVSAEPPAEFLPNWPASARQAYAAYEAALGRIPSPNRLRQWHDLLASEPHIAGTPGDAREIDRLASAMREIGLDDVQVHEFWAYLCRPVAAQLEIVNPGGQPSILEIKERPLTEDPASTDPNQTIAWNAYSGNGDVTANVVYANFGTKADFAKLAELGVDCHGKVVLARYGGNYRGFKAKFAQAAGAVGLVIYTDPADEGYAKGIMYPEGGYANDTCIQRGSILVLPYQGDPLTPNAEATKDAQRLDPAQVELPAIPVQPIGWGSASQIMSRMTGPGVPDGWQGGLPFAYRLSGGDALQVHLKVEQQREVMRTANVIGTLRGQTHPDEKMILGCHHDAWNCGAADPLCGMICLLESARALAEQAQAGHRPDRSILFAAWGAEEFGIIGSSEWVEANTEDLTKNAVAYVNMDMAAMGTNFGSSAAPSLRRIIAEAAKAVPQARDKTGRSVFDAWWAQKPSASGLPSFGDLGGGSDHVGFYCHAGVPSASLGGHGSKGWSYHSVYDSLAWYRKVVGEDYEPALMVARMATAVAARMADAPLLPIDPAALGSETAKHVLEISKKGNEAELKPLREAAERYTEQAVRVRGKLVAAVGEGRLAGEGLERANRLLMALDRAWLDESEGGGVPGRPWFRNLYAAPDEDSGYAEWMLPALRWAIEHKDSAALSQARERYLAIVERMTGIITELESLAD